MIKLIVDTTCEISPEEGRKLGIISMPMQLTFDDTSYTPGVDMTNEEFYKKLKESKNLPHTSQLNIYDYVDVINPIIKNGDEAFVMCISNKLSGSFNSLEQAVKELNTNKVEILNTATVTFAYHLLVFEAIKLIKQGVTLKELKSKMDYLTTKIDLFAIVDNVNYLIKGGRLSSAVGFLVKTLHIKPIVQVVDGELKVVSKSIGQNSARKAVNNLIVNMDKTMPIVIGHSDDLEKANLLKSLIEKEQNVQIKGYCEVGPIIGTHAGPSCVGVAYFKK